MGVFLKRRGEGYDPRWHCTIQVGGVRKVVALNPWHGTLPCPELPEGDEVFQRSKAKAERRFEEARDTERSAEDEAIMVRKMYRAKYGGDVKGCKIADLRARWDALPNSGDVSEGRRNRVHSVLSQFETFMAKHFPRVREVGALKEEHFRAYLDAVEQSGVSARSWNDHLSIIRAIVRRVDARCKGFRDFLAERRKKPECTVHRNPYSPEELNAILATAAEIDPELHGPIVGAVCTALRKGDICRLRWSDIDMDGEWTSGAACFKGRVTVKTAKTGETISFPVLPPFRRVLEEAAAKRKAGVPYVWPRVALLYSREPSALDRRLRKILRAVGFAEPEQAEGKYPAPEDAEAAAILLEDGMEREGWTAKRRAKARRILALHFKGKNQKDIAGEIGTGKGAVCDYFKAMEDAGRMALVSPPKRETPGKPILAEVRDDEPRKRRASLCGWHSFRTTFCTLALECGVPMEILRKVTGHKTAEIVLRFYDRRGMESMVGAFAAMPQAIAGAAAPVAALPAKTAQDAEPLEGECVDVPQRLPSGLAALLDKATPEQLAQLSAVAEALMRGAGK